MPLICLQKQTGYHLNKAQGLAYLAHQGFKFYVHHDAYILHYPHAVAKEDRRRDIQSNKSKTVRGACVWGAMYWGKTTAPCFDVCVFDAHFLLFAVINTWLPRALLPTVGSNLGCRAHHGHAKHKTLPARGFCCHCAHAWRAARRQRLYCIGGIDFYLINCIVHS